MESRKAEFTEFYSEYIANGGQVPSAFGLIPSLNNVSFEDLFLEHFCVHEIGFETEELFAIKLNAKADIVCPIYKSKITELNSIVSVLNSSEEELQSTFINPKNTTITAPNIKALAGQLQTTRKGLKPKDMLELKQALERDKMNVYNDLLNEFNSLFMGVYK